MNAKLLALLAIVFLLNCSMSCNRGLVYGVSMDIEVLPSPVLIQNEEGMFELILTLPPAKDFKKLDSIKIQLTRKNELVSTPIGDEIFVIPGSWDDNSVLRRTAKFRITDFNEEGSRLYLKAFFYKKSRGIPSIDLEVAFIRKNDR